MHRLTITRILFFSFIFLFLVSCSSSTSTDVPVTETPVLSMATVHPIDIDTPLPTETFTPYPTLQPTLERPQYVMDLQLNYSTKAAVVNETITYPNWTGEILPSLVLAVEPNLWSGGFSIKSLTVDDQPVTTYTLENLSQRLEIQLPQPLQPSGITTIKISYGLILPQMQAYSNPNEVRPQIYGFSERQINLVEWYPFVVPYASAVRWMDFA